MNEFILEQAVYSIGIDHRCCYTVRKAEIVKITPKYIHLSSYGSRRKEATKSNWKAKKNTATYHVTPQAAIDSFIKGKEKDIVNAQRLIQHLNETINEVRSLTDG